MNATTRSKIITDWKVLWQLVSGIHHATPEATVLTELMNVTKELQDGLLQFAPTSSSDKQLEILLKEKKQEKLLPFTQRLQDFLDLETNQCWEILCYYLANECRGSASLLTTLISTESNMTKLLDDIWGYYSLERMIVLKIVKNLLIFYKVPNHPYHSEYKKVVDSIKLETLRESYLRQLEHLINETPPSKLTAGEFFNYQAKLTLWSERNAREINETLHILLLICEHLQFELEQIKRLFACFKQHSFGKQQRYFDVSRSLHAELITRLTYSEVILFLKCVDFEDAKVSSELVLDIIEALDRDVTRTYHNPENGPLLFAWMILNFRSNKVIENQEMLIKYTKLGKRALGLNCFQFLHSLVTNSMFGDDTLISRIVRKTIYNLLTFMCDFFDGDGSCARHSYIYELLCELLSWPTLAKEFCANEESGVRSLYNTLLEFFPIDFVNLSLLANALTKAGMGNYIKLQLESLPILTDTYDEGRYPLRVTSENEYELTKDVMPYHRIDFTITAGSTAVVLSNADYYTVHFRTSVNYFNVLHHEINCLLSQTVELQGDYDGSQRVCRVEAGLRYLESALHRTKVLSAISVEMVHPTEMCIDILNKFKLIQHPPVGLLANCLNVCTALLPLVDSEIFTRITNLNMLPVISNDALDDFKKYALGGCFDSQLLGNYLVNVEKKRERYDFLSAYLGFLRTYTKLQRNNLFKVEIPGLIFLLREVFPHMHSWRFQVQTDKNKIYAEIMGFICDILDAVSFVDSKETKENSDKQLLRDICVYGLLNLENGLILLRFVAVGNAYLQHSMEMESNWMVQQSHGLVLLVRLAMRILMQLLRLKSTTCKSTELSPLEALIYTQPKQRDTLRIIPVVTSYMSNIFDRWLPILSCRLLKRIALEFNMSLLACLDMEPDQIRLTFLQKLPDELESDSLKVAILELVEACIEKQPGMTEAFFKVDHSQEKRLFGKEENMQIADSILTYMEDYLEAVAKEPHTIENILPSKIMNLFHSLWKQNMQILVENLIRKPTFWENLSNPLFSELQPNVRAYTQLLNIFAIEIFSSSPQVSPELQKVMQRFFEPLYFEKWLHFIFDMPKTPIVLPIINDIISDEMPDWLCRLEAFKGFLTILLKKQPQCIEIPTKQFKLLAGKCLEVLVERSEYLEDLRPFIILAEMYLFIIQSFKHSYTESQAEDRTMLNELIKLLGRIASCYEDLHVRAKQACLAIVIKCTDLLAEELLQNSTFSFSFLHSVISIICTELQNLENCVKAEVQSKKGFEALHCSSENSIILCLNLLKTVATIFHNGGPCNWDLPFISNKVFQRLLSCTSSILQLFSKQKLSVELLDVLIVFAKGNCSAEFMHCDVGDYLWLKLLPPKELLQTDYAITKTRTDSWTVQLWWPIYTRGLELVTILFQKHSNHFLKDVLQFVGIHEEYLVDSLLLGKQSLEPLAINLIKSAVTLSANLVEYEKQWRLEHSQSMFNIMRSVQVLLGHCISMFHQPRNLKCLVVGRRLQLDILRDNETANLDDKVITAFNDLTEIIILCIRCLQRFSPPLLDLICEPEFLVSKWEPIFEIHFGAPKLSENAITLTFGTVLSIVSVYTKVLNLQSYGFHEVPLNILPSGIDVNNGAGTADATLNLHTTNTSQRPFSKSMSVTSISSANCPPNELLANLDGELCLLALEHILMLAATQSMLALKNCHLAPREKQLIRREISSELLTYHEFVRKKLPIDYREHKEIWYRRKQGMVCMLHVRKGNPRLSPNANPAMRLPPPTDLNRRHSADLRVSVVRRLHLQQQQRTPAPSDCFEMTHVISPIGLSTSKESSALPKNPIGLIRSQMPCSSVGTTSTPNLNRPPLRRHGTEQDEDDSDHTKRVIIEDTVQEDSQYENEEDEFVPPEEPKYSPLSYVQLVEEDFLHFMSNLFMVICQSD